MPNSSKTILVVDDDPKIRLLLRRCLESESYKVEEAESSAEVDAIVGRKTIDLVTLDLQLGDESGLDIAANLRAKSNIPIIMVTGKGDVIDKIVGLEMGADDYISKPFHLREVLARVRSVLRRNESPNPAASTIAVQSQLSENILQFEGWTSNLTSFVLTDPNGVDCDMTTADFKLLSMFLESPKRVHSRDQMMDRINGFEWSPNDRAIDNQVARLRKKIESDPANPKIIKTVRGIGYIFAATVTKAES